MLNEMLMFTVNLLALLSLDRYWPWERWLPVFLAMNATADNGESAPNCIRRKGLCEQRVSNS
jgi:hypothetical protein